MQLKYTPYISFQTKPQSIFLYYRGPLLSVVVLVTAIVSQVSDGTINLLWNGPWLSPTKINKQLGWHAIINSVAISSCAGLMNSVGGISRSGRIPCLSISPRLWPNSPSFSFVLPSTPRRKYVISYPQTLSFYLPPRFFLAAWLHTRPQWRRFETIFATSCPWLPTNNHSPTPN